MVDWGFTDTAGILIVAVALFVIAYLVEGTFQTVAIVLGVGLLALWVFNFFLQGYSEGARNNGSK